MIKVQLFAKPLADSMSPAYRRKENALISQTFELQNVYNTLYAKRRDAKDADVKAALTPILRELERYIDVNLDQLNSMFAVEQFAVPSRRRNSKKAA